MFSLSYDGVQIILTLPNDWEKLVKDDVMLGIVTWFNIPKGYGEIYAETGEVFFFTYHALPKATAFRVIERGKIVEFQPSNEEFFGERKALKVSVVKKVPAKHQPKLDQLKGVVG